MRTSTVPYPPLALASHNHKPFGCAALLVLVLFGVSNAEGSATVFPIWATRRQGIAVLLTF
jgi:hypothetical protein